MKRLNYCSRSDNCKFKNVNYVPITVKYIVLINTDICFLLNNSTVGFYLCDIINKNQTLL